MSAKIFVLSFLIFKVAYGVSSSTCSENAPAGEDAEPTSGECLLQNELLKSTVKAEDMEEDGATDEATDGATDESDLEEADEASEDADLEEEEEEDQDPGLQIPKCAAPTDCKGEGQQCVGGLCINKGTLKYKWTLATVDRRCQGKIIGALDKGAPEIMACKKKCQSIPGCTGFNRGKKGAIQSKCFFFSKCTKDTPKGQLVPSPMHNVYFVSATGEVEATKMTPTVVKKTMKVLGLLHTEDEQGDQEAEQGQGQDLEAADQEVEGHEADTQQHKQEALETQEPTKCASKADCKGEGQDCAGGMCIIASSLKYKWTLATVDKKCPGKPMDAMDKGAPEIMACKKKCQSIPGCTGFNRGKKGNIQSKCWFFDKCKKDTPKGQLANDDRYNVYFVSATADAEITVVTKSVKNVAISG